MNKSKLINIYKSLNKGEAIIVKTDYSNYIMISESTLLCHDGFMNIDDYNDDLTIYHDDFIINEVYKGVLTCGFDYVIDSTFNKLIWKRPEVVELTLDQIAEKFGIQVSQLKIKK